MSQKKNNWKDIKDIMADFNSLAAEPRDPDVIPIYAHISADKVKLNRQYIEAQHLIDSTDVFKGAVNDLHFNYLIYVFKDITPNPKNLITIEYVISEEDNEQDPFIETYNVPLKNKKLIARYTSTPFRVFETENKHKKILIFKAACPMTLDSFKELLNTWAKS